MSIFWAYWSYNSFNFFVNESILKSVTQFIQYLPKWSSFSISWFVFFVLFAGKPVLNHARKKRRQKRRGSVQNEWECLVIWASTSTWMDNFVWYHIRATNVPNKRFLKNMVQSTVLIKMKMKEENGRKIPVMRNDIVIIQAHLDVLVAGVDQESTIAIQVGWDHQEVVVGPWKKNPVQEGLCMMQCAGNWLSVMTNEEWKLIRMTNEATVQKQCRCCTIPWTAIPGVFGLLHGR